MINFDADYCHEFSDAEDLALLPDHAHKLIPADLVEENDEITQELCAYQNRRPEWDLRLLMDAGFSRVTVDTGVWSAFTPSRTSSTIRRRSSRSRRKNNKEK